MTFHPRGFHFIISVDCRKMSVLRRIQCAGELQSSCGGSGGDRQTRPDHVCWLEVQLSEPGERGAASGSHPPGQMQLVLLEAGQGEGGDVPSSQRSST